MKRFLLLAVSAATFVIGATFPLLFSHAKQGSLLIVNARIADGTGAPLVNGSVRIADGRIAAIGELRPEPGEAKLPRPPITGKATGEPPVSIKLERVDLRVMTR